MDERYIPKPQELLESAMVCIERGGECNGCNFYGCSNCVDNAMTETNTIEKAELFVQMYLMGGVDSKKEAK